MRFLELINKHRGIDFTELQPFVFKPEDKSQMEMPNDTPQNQVLACPFPFFSIEIDGGLLTSSPELEDPVNIVALACKELKPNWYRFFATIEVLDRVYPVVVERLISGNKAVGGGSIDGKEIFDDEHLNGFLNTFVFLTDYYLSRLHKEKTGTVRASGHAKFRDSSGKKKIYKPRNVIYVADKVYEGSQTSRGHIIRKSNHWTVRAHWRKIKGLGLDRNGDRIIDGYTWVKSHVKGDKDELVQPMVRVVK